MASRATFAYIQTPHVLMREKPEEGSKVVSDAYFSEEVTVFLHNQTNDWIEIQTEIDGYKGWIERRANAVALHKEDFFADSCVVRVDRTKAYIYGERDTEFGGAPLPFESRLKALEEPAAQQRWIKVGLVDGREAFIQKGDIKPSSVKLSLQEMVEFSKKFLDIPYVWGGRSSFGFDCSGFTQMLYRQMGVFLPRDSKDQFAWSGFAPVEIEEMISGDLIFFGLAEDKIRHVGMFLGGSQFIHSTVKESKPWVHISNLKDEDWSGAGTLTFRAARRLKPKLEKRSLNLFKPTVYGGILGLALGVALGILKGSR